MECPFGPGQLSPFVNFIELYKATYESTYVACGSRRQHLMLASVNSSTNAMVDPPGTECHQL